MAKAKKEAAEVIEEAKYKVAKSFFADKEYNQGESFEPNEYTQQYLEVWEQAGLIVKEA